MPDKPRYPNTQALGEIFVSAMADTLRDAFSEVDWSRLQASLAISPILPKIDLGGLDQRLREDVMLLARGGWYPHGEMTIGLIRNAAQAIGQGDFDDADRKMIAYLEGDFIQVKSRILSKLRRRSLVLNSAFEAHERGEYSLSVPVFLIQADGVCYDIAEVQLFNKRDKKPATADFVRRVDADVIASAILSPLAANVPLTASPLERRESSYPKGALNRHQVLHGEIIDYGTKANSLKAISLLWYLCHIRQSLSKRKAA